MPEYSLWQIRPEGIQLSGWFQFLKSMQLREHKLYSPGVPDGLLCGSESWCTFGVGDNVRSHHFSVEFRGECWWPESSPDRPGLVADCLSCNLGCCTRCKVVQG